MVKNVGSNDNFIELLLSPFHFTMKDNTTIQQFIVYNIR